MTLADLAYRLLLEILDERRSMRAEVVALRDEIGRLLNERRAKGGPRAGRSAILSETTRRELSEPMAEINALAPH